MNISDPIADMLTRIRNAAAVGKSEVILPTSKVKEKLAEILKKEGYIANCARLEKDKKAERKFAELKIDLSYQNGRSKFQSLKRISKPGLKIYVKQDRVPRVLNGLGIAIISTPFGMMTNREARAKKCGGEVICEVY